MYTSPEVPLLPDMAITARIFSPWDAVRRGLPNWSLKQLQHHEDVERNSFLTDVLTKVMSEMCVREVLAPHVSPASAEIINSDVLTDSINLGSIRMYRNKMVPADGVFLEPKQAFVMSVAGCPIILASADAGENNGQLIVAHAGRDSLIDRGAIQGKPQREHVSVVHAIIDSFKKMGVSVRNITMVMMYAIPTNKFNHDADHPQYGEFNRALTTFVEKRWPDGILREDGHTFLSLENVFIGQASQAGIRYVWAANSLNKYPLLAHTRDGQNPIRRNLVVVRRNK